jgi:hypothetical protein
MDPLYHIKRLCSAEKWTSVSPGEKDDDVDNIAEAFALGEWQGLTLVHFSAQLEPCMSQEDTLHTPNTP